MSYCLLMKSPAQNFQKPGVRWRLVVMMGLVNLGIYVVFPSCALPRTGEQPDIILPVKLVAAPIFVPGEIVQTVSERYKDAAVKRKLKNRKLTPESEWNRYGTWEKVSSSPPSYVPRGYASSAPAGNQGGTWYVDKRDGKRLFAPNASFRDILPGVWQGEAKKITANR